MRNTARNNILKREIKIKPILNLIFPLFESFNRRKIFLHRNCVLPSKKKMILRKKYEKKSSDDDDASKDLHLKKREKLFFSSSAFIDK